LPVEVIAAVAPVEPVELLPSSLHAASPTIAATRPRPVHPIM
jgi:hypothetical protein